MLGSHEAGCTVLPDAVPSVSIAKNNEQASGVLYMQAAVGLVSVALLEVMSEVQFGVAVK